MMSLSLEDRWAVILCGGRGSRLGSITQSIPKSLVEVQDKPILWHTFLTLYEYGFRNFIFPLGYKGNLIENYISHEFEERDCNIRFVDTGEDTPISKRLQKVAKLIPDHDDFFLINGDTIFDFDVVKMYEQHLQTNALITLSSVEITSNYGVIIEKDGKMVDFERESKVAHFSLNSDCDVKGYINAGIVWFNKDALDLINVDNCTNLEQELYPKIIKEGRANHYKIDGNWFAIDTPKDLGIINSKVENKQKIGDIVKKKKEELITKYSYRTRYYDNVDDLKEKILNKTIIPYQVEVQPGPTRGAICWLPCPYCYGKSAHDSGERLSPERYVEIMKQIAEGGVKKTIFAGYATDPLNYEHIEDLVQVALDNHLVFGFNTKGIRLSYRFIDQITSSSIAETSYISLSIDAGSNEVYNNVHGLNGSKSRLYDRVLYNINKLSDARKKNNAPLDISTVYLINGFNNSSEEVLKAIHDFRDAGSDLIRFSFPQVPRGYPEKENDPYLPARDQIQEYMHRLRPIIENENNNGCHIMIINPDADYGVYRVSRTLPCFARFIYPSISFDGWLSHCSQASAPHFREMALGNLKERDFWDIFYDYDADKFATYLNDTSKKMKILDCKCDRKEHVVNSRIKESGIFQNE